jgi:hypothetical protein
MRITSLRPSAKSTNVMPLQALSVGCEVDIWRPQTGVVHSTFDRAVNLLMDGELWTVLRATRQDAPFGIRLASSGRSGGLDVQVADCVHVRAGYVGVGHLIVDCRMASRWAPTWWKKPVSGLEARLSAVEHMARPRAWAESADMASDVTDALRCSDAELAAADRGSRAGADAGRRRRDRRHPRRPHFWGCRTGRNLDFVPTRLRPDPGAALDIGC